MRRWRLFSLISALSLVLVACGGQGVSPSGSGSATPTSSAPASTGPFTAMTYPEAGPADCSYGGEFSQIKATDEHTVEFTLCYPDPAFLSKLAFASNEIHDTASLEADMAEPPDPGQAQRDRPVHARCWQRGDHITLTANPNYWGEQGQGANPRVPMERRVGRPPRRAPGRHRRRHRQPGPERHGHDLQRLDPAAPPARGAEHALPRLHEHARSVERPEGPPGARHGHRPAAHRRQLLPDGVRGRDPLHARATCPSGARADWYDFDPTDGQAAPRRGRLPERLRAPRSTTATSSGATSPTRPSSRRRSSPSSGQPGHQRRPSRCMESADLPRLVVERAS